MHTRTHTRSVGAIASIAALATTGFASANILISIVSPTQYNYIVHKVPDFDQRRVGLPNNGASYCVPTSALNWFAYIANHGYPNMSPGTGDWSQQSQFNTVTSNLFAMGVLMGTGPDSGTGLNGAVNGMKAWLSINPYPYQFAVIGKNSSSSYSYRFDDLAQQALLGRLVMPRIGWYNMAIYPSIFRDGGHLTCMTAAVRSGSSRKLGLTDPGSDNGVLSVQSAFTREDYTIQEDFVVADGVARQMSRILSYGAGSKAGWIDGYRAIVPLFGLTRSSDSLQSITFTEAFSIGSAAPKSFTVSTGLGVQIWDVAIASDAIAGYALSNSGGQGIISKIDFVTGQSNVVMNLPNAASQLVTGRFGQMYAMGTNTISRIDPNFPKPYTIGTHFQLDVSAIAYDDFNDHVLVFEHKFKSIFVYPHNLSPDNSAPIAVIPLGEFFPTPGNLRWLTVSPVTGHIWYSPQGNNIVYEIIPGDGSVTINPFTAPDIQFKNSLAIDDAGRIYVCDATSVRVYELPEQGNTLVPVPLAENGLVNMPCNGPFNVLVSRHNFDPATANDPAQWDITLPTEFSPSIPGCAADLDGSGIVDVVDLLLLLGSWGTTAGFSDADLNFDGLVDVTDLLVLLNAWGPCP